MFPHGLLILLLFIYCLVVAVFLLNLVAKETSIDRYKQRQLNNVQLLTTKIP